LSVRLITARGAADNAAEKCLLLGEDPGYGELFVLRAIRRGLDTRDKVFRSAGRGVSRDTVDQCMNSALERGLIMYHPAHNPHKLERFILTLTGFETVQHDELKSAPAIQAQASSSKERVADKALGAALLAVGLIVLFTGVAIAMDFVNQPTPEVQVADLGPVDSSEELQAAVLNSVLSAMGPVFWASVRLGATALLIFAGGLVMARGITLFKS